MSENSLWRGLANLMGGGDKQAAKPLETSSRRCEAGHPMAIDWKTCPYCAAAKSAAERTPVADVGTAARRATRVAGDDPGPATRRTSVEMASGTSLSAVGRVPDSAFPGAVAQRRNTMVADDEHADAALPKRRQGGGRRLTGIVVTFSWSTLGQLFEVHEGRNYVGSGVVSMEGDRPSDIFVPEDDKLSSAHFLILCQGKEKYRISDCNSTNGTYVNGELIDNLGIDLGDGALIQAGATLFTFQKVRPPSDVMATASREAAEEAVRVPPAEIRDEDRSI